MFQKSCPGQTIRQVCNFLHSELSYLFNRSSFQKALLLALGPGPVIPQVSQYLYFLFAPTLIYRDKYPRYQFSLASVFLLIIYQMENSYFLFSPSSKACLYSGTLLQDGATWLPSFSRYCRVLPTKAWFYDIYFLLSCPQVLGCLFYAYYVFVRLCIPQFRSISMQFFDLRAMVLCVFNSILPGNASSNTLAVVGYLLCLSFVFLVIYLFFL